MFYRLMVQIHPMGSTTRSQTFLQMLVYLHCILPIMHEETSLRPVAVKTSCSLCFRNNTDMSRRD